jgi:FKBP-type peptidyl-prolyl cis-trans isomerase
MGGQFKGMIDADSAEMDAVCAGFADTMKGTLKEDPVELLKAQGPELNKILQERSGRIVTQMKEGGAAYAKEFAAANPTAVTTPEGLVFLSTQEGNGKQPNVTDTVEVHYHGMLTDGTVFDSSVQRGQTISFPLSNVVKGWQIGVAMMKEGGKATLVVPSDLAYGDGGSGDTIPPGATLKFEVELFKVN